MLPLVLLYLLVFIATAQNYYGEFRNQNPQFSSSYPAMYPQQSPPAQYSPQQYNPTQIAPQNQMYQPFQQTNQQYQPQPYQQSNTFQQSNQQYPTMAQNYQSTTTSYPRSQLQNYSTTSSRSSTSQNRSQFTTPAGQVTPYDGSDTKDCTAPRARGDFCSTAQQRQMFYYDAALKICQPFMYNGCNGSGNRFETSAECKQVCIDGDGANRPQQDGLAVLQSSMKAACSAEYAADHLTPEQCGSGEQCSTGYQCTSGFCCPTPDYLCNLRYDSGKFAVGGEKSDRYFYTSQYKTCMRFSFYGSLGNANNFLDYNSCMRTCGSQQ